MQNDRISSVLVYTDMHLRLQKNQNKQWLMHHRDLLMGAFVSMKLVQTHDYIYVTLFQLGMSLTLYAAHNVEQHLRSFVTYSLCSTNHPLDLVNKPL